MPGTKNPKTQKSKQKKYRKRGQRKWRAPRGDPLLKAFISNNAFKPIKFSKLRYCDTYKLSTVIAQTTPTVQQFRLNSLVDPDLTGYGHQPYGYDQLVPPTGPYSKYQVYGVAYNIRAVNMDNKPMTICLNISNLATTINSSSLSVSLEKQGSISKILDSDEPITFSGYIPLNQVFGMTKTQYMANSVYQADYTANPLADCFLTVGAYNSDYQALTATQCCITVELVQYAKFFDIETMAQST